MQDRKLVGINEKEIFKTSREVAKKIMGQNVKTIDEGEDIFMDATTNKVEKVDQMLPIGDLVLLGIQHIAAMCAGAMAVPIILGNILGLDSVQINHLVSASFMMARIRNFDSNI